MHEECQPPRHAGCISSGVLAQGESGCMDTTPAGEPKTETGDLPGYGRSLRACHRAFGRDLRRAVRAVPLDRRGRVLDIPCGDGFYTVGLARRLFPDGRLVAADLSDAYLDLARRRFARVPRLAP